MCIRDGKVPVLKAVRDGLTKEGLKADVATVVVASIETPTAQSPVQTASVTASDVSAPAHPKRARRWASLSQSTPQFGCRDMRAHAVPGQLGYAWHHVLLGSDEIARMHAIASNVVVPVRSHLCRTVLARICAASRPNSIGGLGPHRGDWAGGCQCAGARLLF